jgi:hypothetical protein
VNNYSNSLLTPNLSRIRNNFRPTDRIKKISINTIEPILEKDYVIVDLDLILYLTSYLIVRRNIMFVVNQAIGLRDIF